MRLWEMRICKDSQGFVRLWERICKDLHRLWDRIPEDSQDFGRGSTKIHNLHGFMRLWERICKDFEDSQDFGEIHKDSRDFGRGFARILRLWERIREDS